MPSKRIIVLDRQLNREITWGNQTPQFWAYALWADVPVGRQNFYANAAFQSAVKTISAPDLTALQNGSVVERISVLSVEKGTSIPQLQATLQSIWADFQTEITGYNPWNRYGTFWDGATWTAGGAT